MAGDTIPICRKELRRYFASPIAGSLLVASGLLFALGAYARDPRPLMGPVSALSSFKPGREFLQYPRVALLVSLGRLVTMFLIPMITMPLFIEEKRSRTIEMLFTSPVRDREIIAGKWIAAMALYLSILALSVIGFAIFRWPDLDWRLLPGACLALASQAAGLAAIGECISTFTRHESAAALGTLLVCIIVMKFYGSGVMKFWGFVFCGALTVSAWLLTWRSIQTLRGAF